MKHLQTYKLFESIDSEINFDKVVEVLSTECSEFLDLLEKLNIEEGKINYTNGYGNSTTQCLYRGHKLWDDGNIVKGFWKIKPFENRLSRDTKSDISKLLDEGFEKKFGIPLRSKGVFTSKDWSTASDYGRHRNEAFLFFPKNGFRYFWNPEVDDLFTLLRDDISWYEKDPFFWNSSEKREFQQIIDGYQEGEIEKVKWQEITFICDEYYLLDLDYYDEFLNYFIK
jgi:hypothetical protein